MDEITSGLVIAGIIVALLQIAKPFLSDPRTWPIAGLLLGMLLTALGTWGDVGTLGDLTIPEAVFMGVYNGLVASGVYAGAKAGNDVRVNSSGGGS